MRFIQYQEWKLYYSKKGERGEPLLLFHGFGQTHAYFNPLVEVLKEDYQCYSFDLFYHGKSAAPKNESLDIETWEEIFKLFISKENITEFCLCGFSLGGKYVLAILMSYAPKISQLLLMAPDGIKTNIWYNMATYPYPLRRFFRSTIRHPQRLYIMIRFLGKIGIIKKRVMHFVEKQMESPSKRKKVYDTWVGMRKIKFKTRMIRNKLIDHDIHTIIFIGDADEIIPLKPFFRFCNQIPSCKVEVMNSGHYDLVNHVADYYSKR